jgi:hypothetical protein
MPLRELITSHFNEIVNFYGEDFDSETLKIQADSCHQEFDDSIPCLSDINAVMQKLSPSEQRFFQRL